MIARATHKAERHESRATFKAGAAQALPFPDAHFDVAVTTLVLHHLPRPSRQQLAQEMRRLLKPGGRVLAINFGEGGHSHKRGDGAVRSLAATQTPRGDPCSVQRTCADRDQVQRLPSWPGARPPQTGRIHGREQCTPSLENALANRGPSIHRSPTAATRKKALAGRR